MDDDTKKVIANWLIVVAKIASYLATALVGGLIGAGCRNPSLINLQL